ncbi:MAG: endo-1,4-beta-xylanase [Bacteroidota bacterium]
MRKHTVSIVVILLIFTACSKKSSTGGGGIITPPPPTMDTVLYSMMPFPMGAALSVNLMKSNTKYSGVVKKEYNSITAENAMKFAALHPAQSTYNWTDADYLVDFARLNGKRIHGHTLVWYTSLPSWVTNFVGDSAAWENLLKTHIQTVVTHFKGKVGSWDVVNEDFEDSGIPRNSIWRQKLGNDYVARCFQYAYQADSTAVLFYNDYGNEYSSAKRTAIINMVNAFKSRGIPIHGIGMQFHTTSGQSDANISAAINTAASTGLKVHLSELDVRLNAAAVPGMVYTPALGALQASRYLYIVKTYNAIPASQKFGITTWNVGDADSWIPGWQGAPDWPLPFDGSYLRKPAYYGIINGAK